MKIVKLNEQHPLWHHGYRAALKFDSIVGNTVLIWRIRALPVKTLGWNGKKIQLPLYFCDCEYLLGFESKQEITAALLQL